MKAKTNKQGATAVKTETGNPYLDGLDEERRHNLTAPEDQLERERAERIEDFRKRNCEWLDLEEIISHMVIQEHIRINGFPKDEYRNYKILAFEVDRIFCHVKRTRTLLEDVESGARHLLTTTDILPKIEGARYDPTSACKDDIFYNLVLGEGYTEDDMDRIIGKTVTLRTIDGVPMLPTPDDDYAKGEITRFAEPTYKPEERKD